MSPGPKPGEMADRPNVMQPRTVPRAASGTDRNEARPPVSSGPPDRCASRRSVSGSSRSNTTGVLVSIARKLGESPLNTTTSPGRSSPSVTVAGWPTSRAASRRMTAVGPTWRTVVSSAASSRSAMKMAAASANAGTATLTTSRAVSGRSRVVPIRSAARRTQPAPITSDAGSWWFSRGRTRCPRCPASPGTTRSRHRPAAAARGPRRARPAVRLRPRGWRRAPHPRARCRPARQGAPGS